MAHGKRRPFLTLSLAHPPCTSRPDLPLPFRPRFLPQAQMPRLALCLGPLAVATAIAASRLTDYRHHFSDVNAGRRGVDAVPRVSCLSVFSLLRQRDNVLRYLFCPQLHRDGVRDHCVPLQLRSVLGRGRGGVPQAEEAGAGRGWRKW